MSSSPEGLDWGSHLQIVFSVLVGVSFAEALTTLGESHFKLYQLLLIATVFYVVLDNWYHLNKDLVHLRTPLQTANGFDIALFLVTLVSYSCLPFLYFAHTASTSTFGPPEFLAANLSAICILDALRRNFVFLRNKKVPDLGEQVWHKKNTYLILTGWAYGLVLAVITAAFSSSQLSLNLRAGLILVAWLLSRGVDYLVIEHLSGDNSSFSPNDGPA
jgi:hypothetical protein